MSYIFKFVFVFCSKFAQIQFIDHSLGPIGVQVKLTVWHSICHTQVNKSHRFKGYTAFKIFQSLTLPINRSTWILVHAILKFLSSSPSEN